jgi:XTP/dITP diphosphohydrolase
MNLFRIYPKEVEMAPENSQRNTDNFSHETPDRTVFIASNNRHKQAEITAITQALALPTVLNIRLASDLVPDISWNETGHSFIENAMIKAQAVKAHTRDCVLADDSGLVVDVLNGEPGVYSSRYAGREGDDAANNSKLLAALKDIPWPRRVARFVCSLIFIDERGEVQSFTGECHGHIALSPRGTNGFGYDPLFIVAKTNLTMAELSCAEKNSLSHRGIAIHAWSKSLLTNASQV